MIDSNFEHELAKVKRNKHQEKIYQGFKTSKLLEEYIIKIAYTLSDLPEIYFPIKLDSRGRLYPLPIYFNFKGSELAKSLIQFAIGDIITRDNKTSIEHLKCYGATCFGNGLDKKILYKKIRMN